MKYGVDQCIGDTMGPGGIFRAPAPHPGAAGDRQGDAGALPATPSSSTTPTPWRCAAGRWARCRDCSSSGSATACRPPWTSSPATWACQKDEIDFVAAGINHMAWFLQAREGREGPVPDLLKANFEKPGYYAQREGARRGHAPFRLLHDREHRPPLGVPALVPQEQEGAGPVLRRAGLRRRDRRLLQVLQRCSTRSSRRWTRSRSRSTKLGPRSAEYCSHIIEAEETGDIFRLNGNVRNDGYITNLPNGCCVEVPIYVDRTGLHPTVVGALPRPLAALNMTNVLVQGLSVEAALRGDPELLVQACALDPLDRGGADPEGDPGDDRAEMLEAQRTWLPPVRRQEGAHRPGHHHPAGREAPGGARSIRPWPSPTGSGSWPRSEQRRNAPRSFRETCAPPVEGRDSRRNSHGDAEQLSQAHNATWPGVVGKGAPGAEPPIDLDTMLDLTAAAEVNGVQVRRRRPVPVRPARRHRLQRRRPEATGRQGPRARPGRSARWWPRSGRPPAAARRWATRRTARSSSTQVRKGCRIASEAARARRAALRRRAHRLGLRRRRAWWPRPRRQPEARSPRRSARPATSPRTTASGWPPRARSAGAACTVGSAWSSCWRGRTARRRSASRPTWPTRCSTCWATTRRRTRILPPDFDWNDQAAFDAGLQDARPTRCGPGRSISTSPRTTPRCTAPARTTRPAATACRTTPTASSTSPQHAGYWLRDEQRPAHQDDSSTSAGTAACSPTP